MIIDAHCHLPTADDAVAAAEQLVNELGRQGVDRALVLHMPADQWDDGEFCAALAPWRDRLSPVYEGKCRPLDAKAVHVHFRARGKTLCDERTFDFCSDLAQQAGRLKMPVILDAFPDGDAILQGFDPRMYAMLCAANPNTKFVITHMGGHYVLDFLMLAKRIPNMYFDCSFSPVYYRDSHVTADILYAIGSLGPGRVMYGSDYPEFSMRGTMNKFEDVLEHADLFGAAAMGVFGWEK